MTWDIEQLLRWASLLPTLPVVLYSAAPFFQRAGATCACAAWAWTCWSRSVWQRLRRQPVGDADRRAGSLFLIR